MNIRLLAGGACAAIAMTALAAQNRPPEFAGPRTPVAAALDADRDGAVSAAEIRSSAAALRTLDRNGDGQLTSDEVAPAFGREGRRGRGDDGERGGGAAGAAPDDLAGALMAFDRNGDGKLVRGELPERFQGLLERADANRDGALTEEELKQSANAATTAEGGRRGPEGRGFDGRGRGGPGDPLRRALDRDGDGVISPSEIDTAAEALKALDTNQDGQLSNDEIRPVPGRGRGGRR